MIRTALKYHRPKTCAEASAILLEHHGNAGVLGGGTLMIPRMTRHAGEFEHVVDLKDLDLAAITEDSASVWIGARTTYADVVDSDVLVSGVPLLPRMARGVTGGRQVTQQATLVGAACFQFPTTDVPGVLVALDARVEIHGPNGRRAVPIREFFLDAFSVDLRPGEFVTAVRLERQPMGGYCKVKHSTGSWPIVTASAVPRPSGGVRVTLGAVQAVPVVVDIADPADPDEVTRSVDAAVTDPWSDVLAPGQYRADIAGAVARRALADLRGDSK